MPTRQPLYRQRCRSRRTRRPPRSTADPGERAPGLGRTGTLQPRPPDGHRSAEVILDGTRSSRQPHRARRRSSCRPARRETRPPTGRSSPPWRSRRASRADDGRSSITAGDACYRQCRGSPRRPPPAGPAASGSSQRRRPSPSSGSPRSPMSILRQAIRAEVRRSPHIPTSAALSPTSSISAVDCGWPPRIPRGAHDP